MDEQLFQVHARCPLASQVGEIHQASRPMAWLEAELVRMDWMLTITAPGWKFTIEEADKEDNS